MKTRKTTLTLSLQCVLVILHKFEFVSQMGAAMLFLLLSVVTPILKISDAIIASLCLCKRVMGGRVGCECGEEFC